MKLTTRIAQFALAGAMAVGLASNALASDKTANTLLGAGLGAAAGAVLSDGDPLLTLGGAAAGGVLGNVLTDDHDYRGRHWRGHDRRAYRGGHDNYRRASWHRDNGWHRGHHKHRHHRRHRH
ncbi:hypothetical protein ERD78_14625 [Allopusillimonas soli]|uniref:Glycine zipper 2TM domain-containing protein n=1 Tax=Allopusillimonas soli TaxID=659016 RepID=A0A853FEJ8_9BURK|nr:hypothetical protein [Allopusillimonas soli]NYT38118.1 hypothetical protein [Allopusillimonas soli]TEA73995.1 hypothetical protein ERD78_14625 [Allopusillimonas soli]